VITVTNKAIPTENKKKIQDAPLFRRIRLHASKRLEFPPETNKEERVKGYKKYLALEDEMLQRYHRKGDTGLQVTMARAIIIDVLVEHLFSHAVKVYNLKTGTPPIEVSILATGGYGRGELNPYSDIDLMFLLPEKCDENKLQEFQQVLSDEILYPLWDLKLKVGHSFRNMQAVLEEASANLATMNSMLEVRLITGSQSLFNLFQDTFNTFFNKQDIRNTILQQIEERKRRHSKFSNTVFLQAPDIKNGPGGLRDYQSILWMARAKFGTFSMEELVNKNILSDADHKKLVQAYSFLLKVRNELHFQFKKSRDELSLEKQGDIATNLGYEQKDLLLRIEYFMRDYYGHARRIYRISKNIARLFRYEENQKYEKSRFRNLFKSDPKKNRKHVDGFILGENQIYFEHNKIFEEDPYRIIKVFRLSQQTGLSLDFELRRLIQESRNLMTSRRARSQKATKIFLAIIREVGNVFETLLLMHELCVLGKILPEFMALECMVQHEYYHRYTADLHVLNTIKELDQVFINKEEERNNYNRVIRETDDPARLYVMLLLHDLGKALGIKNHAINGVPIAKNLCKRWGIESPEKEQICFIVEHHLEMARFWQKHDLDDPKTIDQFAHFIKDEETLRYLYVHNYCDSKGTSIDLWSDYKNLLHTRLYNTTMAILKDKQTEEKNRKLKIQKLKEKVLERKLTDISSEEINAHFDSMPDRYFANIEISEIVLHIQMVHRLLKTIQNSESVGSLQPIFDWKADSSQGVTTVNVVTWDRAGLFYKLAGALSVAGLNIISTKAVSRSDHITIDTFYVVESDLGIIADNKVKSEFAEKVNKALLRNEDLWPDILEQIKSKSKALFKSDTEKLGINPQGTVNVYNEISMNKIIIEINAIDNVGLLYQVGKTIYEHGFDISFARISTENSVAIDTFYIAPIAKKVVSDEKLQHLKDGLILILGMFQSIRNGNG
jgi:[protein-PII] uridylyltransferase